ncbi:response regulator [Candidatus Saccharibacteria bacterium]|nr:response regulator [Candidatus Saccharibacteria bacterium]
MIFIIDDDEITAKCIAKAAKRPARIFNNAIEAMDEIARGELPEIIFMDIMLAGPDGFTFLNELISYTDTAKIPIVIVSSLDFGTTNLSAYGVVGTLNKEQMTPQEIFSYAKRY